MVIVLVAGGGLSGLLANSARADEVPVSWIGGTSESWNDSGNWSNALVPDNGTDIYDVTVNGATVSVDDPVAINTLTLQGSAQIGIALNSSLTLAGLNSIPVTSSISTHGAGGASTLFVGNGGGGDTITFGHDAGQHDHRGRLGAGGCRVADCRRAARVCV
jgi:hypothetical protein